MARTELEQVRDCIDTLEQVLARSHGGWADQEALEQFQKACWGALLLAEDGDSQAKLNLLLHYSKALFSEDEHRRWDIGPVLGVDSLRRKIQLVLSSFRPERGLPGVPLRRAPRASPT